MSKICQCTVCVNGRMFRHKLEQLPEDQRGYFESLYEDLMEKQMDNDYKSCILDGSWPGSVEILERALANAKEKQQEQKENE
jgi:hypothetical protein